MKTLRGNLSLRTVLVVLACAAILLRAAYFAWAYHKTVADLDVASHPYLFVEQDSTSYFKIALNLIQGRGYTDDVDLLRRNPGTMFRRAPLYSVLIGAVYYVLDREDTDVSVLYPENEAARRIFETPVAVVMTVFNHVLGVLTVLLVGYMVAVLSKSRWAGLIVGIAFAANLVKVATDNVTLPDALVTFFAMLSLMLFLRSGAGRSSTNVALSGVCLGLSVLSKPVTMYLWVILGISLLLFSELRLGRRLLSVALFIVAANVFPSLWTIQNGLVSGVYKYSTQADALMLQHRALGALMERDDLSLSAANAVLEQDAGKLIAKVERELGRPANQAERDFAFGEVGLKFVMANPSWYLRAHVKQLASSPLWGPGGRTGLLVRVLSITVVVLSAYSLYLLYRDKQYEIMYLFGSILFYLMNAAVPAPAPQWRYKAWWEPFAFVLSGFAVARLVVLFMSGMDRLHWRCRRRLV